MSITHAFVSVIPDDADATLVRPSNWNAAHAGTATPDAHDLLTLHTYTGGAALDVLGLSAPNTIALITPSSNPGAASAILKSNATGELTLAGAVSVKNLTATDLTPNAALYADANKKLISLANAAGYLYNNGAGAFSYVAAPVPAAHDLLTLHTYTGGAALDVLGLSAPNAIALLTPSSNPGAASAILKSTAAGSLTLVNLNLSATSNQMVLQSAGVTGTLTWTPAASNKIITLPNATGTAVLLEAANVFTATQTISNTAPTLVMTDTTGAAKGLTIAVDANLAQFRESAGASGSLLALDLSLNRVGIGTAAPESAVHFKSPDFPVLITERTTTGAANYTFSTQKMLATTTGAALDGFGPIFVFGNRGSGGEGALGFFGAVRDGGLDNGKLIFGVFKSSVANQALVVNTDGYMGLGNTVPLTLADILLTNATTNAINNVVTLGHNSTGTPAAGFGTGLLWRLESSTTNDTAAGLQTVEWAEATHASRKARMVLSVYDTAVREGFRIEASGAAPMIGFFGHVAAVQPTKAGHNNWANISDVTAALAELGLVDAA